MRTPLSPLLLDSVVIDLQVYDAGKEHVPIGIIDSLLPAVGASDGGGQREGYATAPPPEYLTVDHHSLRVSSVPAATGHSLALRQLLWDRTACAAQKRTRCARSEVANLTSCPSSSINAVFSQVKLWLHSADISSTLSLPPF